MKRFTELISICLILTSVMYSTYIVKPGTVAYNVQAVPVSSCNVEYPKTITFKSGDGLTITADLYMTANKCAPFIILFHQAGYSRGEYKTIAPRLNKMGFNCLAVDQRSGDKVNDVVDETAAEAAKLGLAVEFPDAYPDLVASLKYVKNELKASKIIIWGSSYSASLSLILGSEYPCDIAAILAFSPGEYFEFQGKKVADYAANIKCPFFVTAEAKEYIPDTAKSIYDSIKVCNKVFFKPAGIEGVHGSSTLNKDHANSELYWTEVTKFLCSVVK
ncbi:MAG: alpha/beta hydrolase [Oscillospiraceae bacterium]|nr:alpha/beta hydrolase [Oscillospiraceae bacterium]